MKNVICRWATGEKKQEFIQTHSVKLAVIIFSYSQMEYSWLRDKGFINWFVQNVTSSFYFNIK